MTDSHPSAGDRGFDDADDLIAALVRAAGPRQAPSAAERERVGRAAHAAWRAVVARRRRRRFLYALAAGVAVTGVAGMLLLPGGVPAETAARVETVSGTADVFDASGDRWQPLARGAELARGAVLRTQGGRAALTLVGGESLRIGERTQVEIATATRAFLRSGTLYFDSGGAAESGGGRLEIVTPHGALRDLGTQFEAHSSTASLRVRVREGAVEVLAAGTPAATVAAGEEAALEGDGPMRRRSFPADHEAWEWAVSLASLDTLDGRIALDVLRWAAREMGKELRFADPTIEQRLGTTVLSGAQPDLKPAETLDVVIATADGLAYELVPGAILVRRR
jgi:ferric-dicitrate binding protein FerR (iron transport regulator)